MNNQPTVGSGDLATGIALMFQATQYKECGDRMHAWQDQGEVVKWN
jgi:hypothetical protein